MCRFSVGIINLFLPWGTMKIFSCLVSPVCPVRHADWLEGESFSRTCYWMLLDHHISCWYNHLALAAFIITYYKNRLTKYVYPQNWRGRWRNLRSVWCAGRPWKPWFTCTRIRSYTEIWKLETFSCPWMEKWNWVNSFLFCCYMFSCNIFEGWFWQKDRSCSS